jgi:uncharacterized protein (DUF305 family)
MAVAGKPSLGDEIAPEDHEGTEAEPGPTGVGRGGPPEHGRTPSNRRRALVLAAPLLVLALVAIAATIGYRSGQSSTEGPGTDAAASDGGPTNTLKAQPIDVGFAADMYDHHEQAVQMSLIIMDKTTNPGVRSHAVRIAAGQRRESGMFEQFLIDRGITFIDPRRTVMAWMGEPVPSDQMPGMASADEIIALTNATGDDADRLFLDLMIRHHDGGIHMGEYAAAHAETQSMRDFAARIVLDQQREVNDLAQLRSELDP